MSEQGWREFLGAAGVGDWVVLHGGAVAVFVVPSLAAAVRLAQAVAGVPGFEDSAALMTITGEQLTVRLTRDVWRREQRHAELARAVSEVARAHQAVADRARVQEVQLAVAARPDEVSVGFWRAVLGYAALEDDNGVDPLGHGSTVWMQQLDPARTFAARDARRRVRGPGAGRGTPGCCPAGRRPHRRAVGGAGSLGARRPRRQPRVHRGQARRRPTAYPPGPSSRPRSAT